MKYIDDLVANIVYAVAGWCCPFTRARGCLPAGRRRMGGNRSVPPLAQPIEASLAKPDLNAATSVSISASVIGVENTHAPVLMMLQPSLWR